MSRLVELVCYCEGWNRRKLLVTSGVPRVSFNCEVSGMSKSTDGLKVRSRLEKAISELQGVHKLLLSSNSDVDPDVLADFRDALNRVRNTAWAAQQYVVRKETEQDSASVLSLLAGERIRTAHQLCQALVDDLTGTDIKFQRGSLVQLCEITETLTKKLKGVINRL